MAGPGGPSCCSRLPSPVKRRYCAAERQGLQGTRRKPCAALRQPPGASEPRVQPTNSAFPLAVRDGPPQTEADRVPFSHQKPGPFRLLRAVLRGGPGSPAPPELGSIHTAALLCFHLPPTLTPGAVPGAAHPAAELLPALPLVGGASQSSAQIWPPGGMAGPEGQEERCGAAYSPGPTASWALGCSHPTLSSPSTSLLPVPPLV